MPGTGDEARDGRFAFTVTKVVTLEEVRDQIPQGVYILVSMTIRNIGNGPQTYFVSNQKLIDNAGREHGSDFAATLECIGGPRIDINPGNEVETCAIFDIPASADPVAIELHDSLFSKGVTVRLR